MHNVVVIIAHMIAYCFVYSSMIYALFRLWCYMNKVVVRATIKHFQKRDKSLKPLYEIGYLTQYDVENIEFDSKETCKDLRESIDIAPFEKIIREIEQYIAVIQQLPDYPKQEDVLAKLNQMIEIVQQIAENYSNRQRINHEQNVLNKYMEQANDVKAIAQDLSNTYLDVVEKCEQEEKIDF